MDGRSQAVRLPKQFRFAGTEVSIRKEGESVVLEPTKPAVWPEGFFAGIRIDDDAFARPEQDETPPRLRGRAGRCRSAVSGTS